MSWPAAWGRYRTHLEVELGRRPNTITTYRKALYGFNGFIQPKSWQRAGPRDLQRFLDRPSASGTGHLAANSRRLEAVAVTGFYRWVWTARLIGGRDRMGGFTPPRGGQPVSRALPVGDVGTILAAAAGDERLELMAWLAYGAGLRVSEIAAARIEDVALRAEVPMLAVPDGKGGKARVVPLASSLAEVLAGYLARRPGAGPLIESKRYPGQALVPHTVSTVLSRHIRSLGIHESPHALRHSYATELLRAGKGANLYAISKALGHSSTATTEAVYVNSYLGELADLAALLPDPRAGNFLQGGGDNSAELFGLAAMVPVDVRDQLAAAVAVLQAQGPAVAAALSTLGAMTHAAWLATCGVSTDAQFFALDPDQLPGVEGDAAWAEAEAALGIDRGWELADKIRDAHPDG